MTYWNLFVITHCKIEAEEEINEFTCPKPPQGSLDSSPVLRSMSLSSQSPGPRQEAEAHTGQNGADIPGSEGDGPTLLVIFLLPPPPTPLSPRGLEKSDLLSSEDRVPVLLKSHLGPPRLRDRQRWAPRTSVTGTDSESKPWAPRVTRGRRLTETLLPNV